MNSLRASTKFYSLMGISSLLIALIPREYIYSTQEVYPSIWGILKCLFNWIGIKLAAYIISKLWLERGSKIITLKIFAVCLWNTSFIPDHHVIHVSLGRGLYCCWFWNILHESLLYGLYWLLNSDPKPACFLPVMLLSKQKSSLQKLWSLSPATHIDYESEQLQLALAKHEKALYSACFLADVSGCVLRSDHFSKVVIIFFFLFTIRVLEKEVISYVVLRLGGSWK